jgi:hypothetical protein
MPLRRIFLILAVAAMAATWAQPALAAFGITGVPIGATQVPGPPPPNVDPGNPFGGNEGALPIIFHEILGGTIGAGGLDVDHDGSNVVAQPTVSGNVVNPLLIDATIPAGTFFNSYLFHFDPVGTPFFAFYVSTINFDNPIIGVQLFSNGFLLEKPSGTGYIGTLELGDAMIGPMIPVAPGYYPTGIDYRGVEEDAFVLAIAGNQIMIGGSAHGFEIDQIRILTVGTEPMGGVPEPASAAAWAIIGFVCCFGPVLRYWR